MRGYCAYGLRIESELSLPEMIPGVGLTVGSADISIRLGKVRPFQRASMLRELASGDGGGSLPLPQKVGAFLVRHGREIVIDRRPESRRLLRLSLRPALAAAPAWLPIVHASVVAQGDCAVAFLGKNGWGKSTIAAALHLKGYDPSPTTWRPSSSVRTVPCSPQLSAGEALARSRQTARGSSETLPILHPDFDKRGGGPSAASRSRRAGSTGSTAWRPVPPRRSKTWGRGKPASRSWGTGTVIGLVVSCSRTAPPRGICSSARRWQAKSPCDAWCARADQQHSCISPISSIMIYAG